MTVTYSTTFPDAVDVGAGMNVPPAALPLFKAFAMYGILQAACDMYYGKGVIRVEVTPEGEMFTVAMTLLNY